MTNRSAQPCRLTLFPYPEGLVLVSKVGARRADLEAEARQLLASVA